ncbi:uncharacterized protein LOC120341155 isoform X1 [Styela clava]
MEVIDSDIEETPTFTMSSNETTVPNITYFNYYNPGTAFDVAMDCFLILAVIISFYILMSLCYYEWHWHQTHKNRASTGKRKNSRFRTGPWLRILCILSAFFSFMRCVNDIIYYKASDMSDIPCTILKNIGVSWLIEVDTTVYLFLWLRQRVLYQKRIMRRMANPLTSICSWMSLVLIVAIFIVMNAALLLWRNYHYEPQLGKCVGIENAVYDVIPTLWLVSSTILHILLVALCVYPLIRHTTKLEQRRKSSIPALAANDVRGASKRLKKESTTPSNGQKNLMQVVTRCVVISLVCVITDGLTIAVTRYWFVHSYETKLRHFIYNINTLINVTAIVCSFKQWKAMLLPCYTCNDDDADADDIDDVASRRTLQYTTTTSHVHANRI